MIGWYVEGIEFSNCNCDYACPCQFERRPTHGNCRGFEIVRIDKGHFGDVTLDGLHVALLYAWPGAIYEGSGTIQAIIDERADEHQRRALATIIYGGETETAKTHWWVYHAMSSTVRPPIFAHIEFEADIKKRQASVLIAGILEATGRPIISPSTGAEHQVRIDIPEGIEFVQAEIASASTRAVGVIELNLDDSYGQFNVLRHSGTGVVGSPS